MMPTLTIRSPRSARVLALAPPVAFARAPTITSQSTDQRWVRPHHSASCGFPVLMQVSGAYLVHTDDDQAGQVSTVLITTQGPTAITLTNLTIGTTVTSNSAGPSTLPTQTDRSPVTPATGL